MALDPLTLVLTNVGLSIFNNWRNNKQSRKLQEKQQEYARASAERNKQRMWQLMREGQELALEMERESHENRVEDIKSDFDNILHRLTYSAAIKTWPLKVLPIVMKNQSLGNLLATTDENIALHCIFTPSNCPKFNAQVFPAIEECLADFCNLHWSTLSSHPILFYSGAWQSGTAPTGVEIDQLKTNLRSLPTLIVTPSFKGMEGNMVFQLHAWGIGLELETEIECANFSNPYVKGTDYAADADLKSTTIEEFVPYLQCLIGYIADQYFWTNHNEAPLLPTLLAMNVVNTDGMQYLNTASEERYSNLLDVCMQESRAMPFTPDKMLSLFEGSAALWDEETKNGNLKDIFLLHCGRKSITKYEDVGSALNNTKFSHNDIYLLSRLKEVIDDIPTQKQIDETIVQIKSKIHCLIVQNDDLPFEDILTWCEEIISKTSTIRYVSIEISDDKVVAAMLDADKHYLDNEHSPLCCIFEYNQLVVPKYVVIKNKNILVDINKFYLIYNQIFN